MASLQSYDAVIIGGGHNGLVCATYLAKAGQRVLLLEASDTLGGLAATREFHPGFHVSVAHSLHHFSAEIAKELNLQTYGLAGHDRALATVALAQDGRHVQLSAGSVSGVSDADIQSYARYLELLSKFAKVLRPFWFKTMPRIGNRSAKALMTFAELGVRLRMLGRQDMGEFMRVATLPARDLMDEYFDSDLLKAALSWDGLIGSKMAPRSPNATVLGLLYGMSVDQENTHTLPVGGVAGLVDALAAAARQAGVEVRTGAAVERIRIEADAAMNDGLGGQRVTGVELAGGEVIGSARVVSSADPKRTFVDLVGVQNLGIEFTNCIRRLRCDGYVAKLHLALNALPNFSGLDDAKDRMIIAPELDALEFAFDNAKHGELPEQPVLEVLIPTAQEPALAPAGQHVLSAHVMYVPYALKQGWDAQAKETLTRRVIDTLATYAPNINDNLLHAELLTPADLEQTHRVTGGHWHHVEFSADQLLMMRPTYDAGQYATPVPGLFLCGAGCHPGGGLVGAPGHNAAKEILS
ncbi:MAG: NAD(P)/FAD-dependent oxidoreductase [Pseudomonadota bacterium]